MDYEIIPLTGEQIALAADDFLLRYHPSFSIPIPIEDIIDLQLKINIIPIPNLKKALQENNLDIDAYISNDFKSIDVDDYVQNVYTNRYRFTLAHEIAHKELHKYIYDKLEIKKIDDWKKILTDFPDWPIEILENEADQFAGCVLVPPKLLRDEFGKQKERAIKLIGNRDYQPYVIRDLTVGYLARLFVVSESCMRICLSRDRLS